jgi:HEAT repeat protein
MCRAVYQLACYLALLVAFGFSKGRETTVWAAAPATEEDTAIAILQSDASAQQKDQACFRLKRIGTYRAVPALAPLLLNDETSLAARLALEAIPGPEAGEALRAAVEKTDGLRKAGIIDSLGERREVAATATVAKALEDVDATVVASAAAALGKIATPEAARLLSAAEKKIPANVRAVFCDGLLLCADRLVASGMADEARAIYQRLAAPEQPRAVRQAALVGLLKAAGKDKDKLVLEYLWSADPEARRIAAGHLSELSTANLKTLATRMANLPGTVQAGVLEELAARGEKTALPTIIAATKHSQAEVRLAALAALGRIGDAAVTGILLEKMLADGVDQVAQAEATLARRSLVQLKDPVADGHILAAMEKSRTPEHRALLIDVLYDRQAKAAIPLFLVEAAGADREVRTRAIMALGRLAGPAEVPAMLALMLTTAKGPDRDNVEKAIVAVCQRIADPHQRTAVVWNAFNKASEAERLELLPLLGRLGGGEQLREAIRAAMASGEPATREAGVRALCNWPDATVADELFELAQNAPVENHRLWALRAFARVVVLPSDTPPATKLAKLKQAMQLATRDEERGLIIERAAAVRTVESLRFVVPYLEQSALAEKACKTVVELAHHTGLREPHKAEFYPALQKVIAISKDRQLVERAKRYLE